MREFKDSRRFSSEDILNFAELTGDFNPLHFEGEDSKKGPFGRPVVHRI